MSLELTGDIEKCYEAGWSDGLPVVPPYGSLVDDMLQAIGWSPSDVIGRIPSQSMDIRAEQLAAAAVMAGCETRYAPVLRALSDALVNSQFNISGAEVTTGGVAALVVVGGPIVEKLGFAHTANAVGGANARVNATIGRFAQMVRLFCGSCGGTLQQHGTVGHPGRLSFLIAEHPETIWQPFHTQFGMNPTDSAVSVMAAEGPNSVNNHFAKTGQSVLDTIADTISHYGSTNFYYRHACYLVAIAPDHAELITRDFTREEAADYLFRKARKLTEDLVAIGRIPENPREDLLVVPGEMRPPVKAANRFLFVETGVPGGKFSAVIPQWVANGFDIARRIDA